jgi:hypothetical protein
MADPAMTHGDHVALLVNLSPDVILERLSTRLQRIARLRFHRLGPQYSRGTVSQILYGDCAHLSAVQAAEDRLARQLWRHLKGVHPPWHPELEQWSSLGILSGCRGCGRLIVVRLARFALPSEIYAVCPTCHHEGYHPMQLFPEGSQLSEDTHDL